MMPSCDQIGVPIHFHSSTTSGSAFLMSVRILLRVSPRQSPSSAILSEMSSDADRSWFASDFFMFLSWKIQTYFICKTAEDSQVGFRYRQLSRSRPANYQGCLLQEQLLSLRVEYCPRVRHGKPCSSRHNPSGHSDKHSP